MSQRILVLGASGYIGQHLVKRLSEQGFTVLAAARQIDRLKKQQLPGVECYSLDLNQPDALPALLAQADTVYYLVHGMGEGGDFIRHERRVALNVRDALRKSPGERSHLSQFLTGGEAGAIRSSARPPDHRRSAA